MTNPYESPQTLPDSLPPRPPERGSDFPLAILFIPIEIVITSSFVEEALSGFSEYGWNFLAFLVFDFLLVWFTCAVIVRCIRQRWKNRAIERSRRTPA